jgi:hypothetical protein
MAFAGAWLLATVAATVASADEIHVTVGPGAGQISHPNLTVEVGDTIVYTKAAAGLPFHVIEHLDLVPGLTYTQVRTRCNAAYTDFSIECHWIDIILTVPPAQDVIGVPGSPPAGNGLFYGVTITANPWTYRWDTGVWHDQMVVGYLGKQPFTQPRTFTLVDALNNQQIMHNVTIAPDGWFDPPILSVPDDITVNALTPAGVAVSYAATATGYGGAAVSVSCDAPSGSTFPIGTTTVTCTAFGNGDVTTIDSFEVTVLGASEQLDALASASAGIGPGKALANKALEVQALLAAGSLDLACQELVGYQHLLGAQVGKKIDASGALVLTLDAARIAAVAGCEPAVEAGFAGGGVILLPTLLAGLVAGRRRLDAAFDAA